MQTYPARLGIYVVGFLLLGLVCWPLSTWMTGLGQGARFVMGIPVVVALLVYMILGAAWANEGERSS